MPAFEDVEIYYILQPGAEKERGPYSLNQLARMWEDGTISAETLFACQGMEGWLSVETLKERMFPGEKKTKTARPRCPTCHAFVLSSLTECWACGFALPGKKEAPSERTWGEVKSPPRIARPKKGPGWVKGLAFCAAGFVGLILLLAIFGNAIADPNESWKQDAHYTATEFIRQRYPGAREISRYSKSGVMVEGNIYTVICEVDGLNSFGGPVRKLVGVEMELDGDTWRLKHIAQR